MFVVADVFWYREGEEVEELEEGEDVDLHDEGDKHVATLYNVSKALGGQYMCIALSDQGKAIKYFTVTVKGQNVFHIIFIFIVICELEIVNVLYIFFYEE